MENGKWKTAGDLEMTNTKQKPKKEQQRKFRKMICAVFLVLIFSVFHFPFSVLPHRFHTSLTRIDYNAEDKNIEITIQLFTHDLEKVLERFSKKRIDFEKSAEIDPIIEKYLSENFVLQNRKGEKLKLKWVGKELNVDAAMIYLEISSDENPAGFSLQNTIFFESFAEQTNLVIIKYNDKKADLLYKAGDRIKVISENKS